MPHNNFSAKRPSSENMRRSFRTPGSGVRSTQGFTVGWYALPLRGKKTNEFDPYTSSSEGKSCCISPFL
jgi:hypothetical protein